MLLSQILIEHVDEVNRKQWGMKAVSQGMTELEAIIKFLAGKCQALELIHASQHPRNNNSSGVSKPAKHAYVATHSSCVLCRGNHPVYRCKQFRKASSQQRLNLIKRNRVCFNCLGNSYRTSQYKVEWRCKFCSRKHNSLLPCESVPAQKNHRNDRNNERQPQLTRNGKNNNSQSGLTVCHTTKVRPSSQVLLATAIVYVRDKCGPLVKCRALLDLASQGNFVTERLVQQLHLRKFKARIPVQGISEVTKTIHYAASLEVKSRFSNWKTKIDCAVHPKTTGMIPATFEDSSDWGIPVRLMLAAENFNRPNSIYSLLGVDVFFDVLRHDKKTRGTNLRWIVSGKLPLAAPEEVPRNSFFIRNNDNCRDFEKLKNCLIIHGQLKKFCVKNTSRSIPHEMIQDVTL